MQGRKAEDPTGTARLPKRVSWEYLYLWHPFSVFRKGVFLFFAVLEAKKIKSFVFLTAFLGGFFYLTHQFSLWFAIGASYLFGMGLMPLIAFTRRGPQKFQAVVSEEPETAGS